MLKRIKKLSLVLSLFFLQSHLAQTLSSFGNVADLILKKSLVTEPVSSDTLAGRLINYHFVKDTLTNSAVINTKYKLNQLSLFIVGNKFEINADKVIYGKVGSTVITNQGIFDYADTLKVEPSVASQIITYGKHDKSTGSFIYLPKINDSNLLIPELLIFKRNLSKKEKQQIESYLSIKYGISINYFSEKNYLSSAGDVLWNYKKNKKYGYHITGIGRDDLFGLYQKQSKNSGDNSLIMSIDNLKRLNSQNAGSLNDNEFLLWGDNNEDIVFKESDLLSYHPGKDLKRLWKAQIKSQDNLKTNLYFNLKDVETGNQIPKLKIFRTTENYQSEIFELFNGEKMNDSIYVYRNIAWDTDHNGNDYFTLNNDISNEDISIVSDCNELKNGLVKIRLPDNFSFYSYKLVNVKTNTTIADIQNSNSNPLVLNNIFPSQYKITINKNGHDIIRSFDIQDISNQNIEDNYLWQGEPIELDLNYETYQYMLTSPDGSTNSLAPFLLNGLGEYTLNVKNKQGCILEKKLYVLNQTDYATKDQNSIFKEIKLFPNPTHDGNVNIKIVLKSPKNISIQIYNALGRLIKEAKYDNTANVDALLSIPPVIGYYNVKIFIPEESKGYNLLIN
ncbi:T9SS type A sorting domain-containing protein [Epilithonimonas pallida]|uniref:Por secretion system C-terminal sorting domain-containing protein n=1 Tax=Epilithonimonas pallida TaxID=373671 RepID=A0ABY1R2A8_9FLAO|nr:T9SS type A sorting domain-containing protein [Epilithonimonas pallida]SMP90872.1 Por secretion system C-terminal sorting domain-containing protein [Epilithonimonas pallida]